MRSLIIVLSFFLVPAAAHAQTANGQRARVFITDSKSWETSGSAGGADGTFAAHSRGGARPQTAEIIKTFGERCPQVIVNNNPEKANYVVLLDHEGGKGALLHDNKVAVFNSNGDAIVSHSTRSLGNAVKDACEAIAQDWPAESARLAAAAETAKVSSAGNGAMAAPASAKVSVASTPSGADIEVDGNFVGNTPSTIDLAVGEHSIAVKKSGYKDWERKMKVTGGTINLSAELEKAE
jgi:hypothetical protein